MYAATIKTSAIVSSVQPMAATMMIAVDVGIAFERRTSVHIHKYTIIYNIYIYILYISFGYISDSTFQVTGNARENV